MALARRLTACLALAAWLLAAPAGAPAAERPDRPAQPDQGCLSCHPSMAAPMPPEDGAAGHDLACTRCHLGDGQAERAGAAHRGMAANPGALDQAGRACGPCHPGWPAKVAASPMATNMGLIAQTRRLWGAQPDLEPRYAAGPATGLLPLPPPGQTGRPVDDLLRRRCLRCHLWGPGAELAGARRSAGCAACHRPYGKDGRPPQGHGLTKRIPVRQCLTCHAGCGAGAEYTGRIPRDARQGARFLAAEPERAELWQGRAWRPMQPDLHYVSGMACIDCHPRPEIMGDGKLRPAGLLHVGLRCTTCHGRPGAEPEEAVTTHGAPLDHVARLGGGLVLMGKLDGEARRVPGLAGGEAAPAAHRAPGHQRLACHACHSATNPAAWGLMVQRETRSAYQVWRPIAAQGDPQALELLSRPLLRPPARPMPPRTKDYLSGESRPGLWVVSPFFRRFDWRLYGQGPDGRTMLLAPRFQYVVTLLDQVGRIQRGAEVPSPGLGVTPWHPHTTRRATVGCADCHGRARVLGLGLTFGREPPPREGEKPAALPGPPGRAELAPPLWRAAAEGLPPDLDWTRVCDAQGRPLQVFLVPGSRPYPAETLAELLAPGRRYTRWLLRALEEEWPLAEPEGAGRSGD